MIKHSKQHLFLLDKGTGLVTQRRNGKVVNLFRGKTLIAVGMRSGSKENGCAQEATTNALAEEYF